MNYCQFCATALQPGAAFCHHCGAAISQPQRAPQPQPQQPQQQSTAMQGLAQAGMEAQNFSLILVLGRMVGVVAGMVILWFIVGPAFGEENPLAVIIAFVVLFLGGALAGQYFTLVLLRR